MGAAAVERRRERVDWVMVLESILAASLPASTQ